MSLLKENNRQYYEGAQGFRFNVPSGLDYTDFLTSTPWTLTTTFNTDLVFGNYDPSQINYALNNFKLYSSLTATPGSWTEYTDAYTVSGNTITLGLVTSTVNLGAPGVSYIDVATDSLTSDVELEALLLMPDATWTPGMGGNNGWAFVHGS